jgi:hypothetical protein
MLNLKKINPEFERALKNEGLRQEFIDSIDLGDTSRYIETVVYDPDYAEYFKRTRDWRLIGYFMITLTGFSLEDSRGKKSTTYVSERAFSDFRISNGIDFYTSLVDHEGQHAKDYFEGIEVENIPVVTSEDPRFMWALLESRAYEHELRITKKERREVSVAYLEFAKGQYGWYTFMGVKSYARNNTEKQIAEIMLKEYRELLNK